MKKNKCLVSGQALFFTALAAVAFSTQGRADTINAAAPALDLTVSVQSSATGAPIRAIKDSKGTDFSGLVSAVNAQISEHALGCSRTGFLGWINRYSGCQWYGFEPTHVKIVPVSDQYPVPDARKGDLVVVIEGRTTPAQTSTPTVIYADLTYLASKTRAHASIPWWLNNGTVHADIDPYVPAVAETKIVGESGAQKTVVEADSASKKCILDALQQPFAVPID